MKKLLKKEMDEIIVGLKKIENINIEALIITNKIPTIETNDFEMLKKIFRYGIQFKKFNLIPNGFNKISFVKYENDDLKIRVL